MNMFINRVGVQFLLVLLLILVSMPVFAVSAQSIYDVAQYVNWPKNDQPLTFCVLGANPFGNQLAQIIKGKKISGRELEYKHIADGTRAPGCEVLFVSNSKKSEVSDVIHGARSGVLTISEINGFADKGGIIEFAGGGFTVNQGAASRAGISIKSGLLKIAKKVIK